MKRIVKPSVFLLALFFVFAAALPQARAYQWKLDPDHTNFFFEVKHIYSVVRGSFDQFSGDVSFDPAAPEKSSFAFDIVVKSVNTHIGKRDTHLQSNDFFAARDYPAISFRSSSVKKGEGDTFLVEGDLAIKDVTRRIPLVFTYHGEKPHPLDDKKMVAGLDTTLVLDRLDYHVGDGKFYKLGVVDKDVKILVSIEMLRDR